MKSFVLEMSFRSIKCLLGEGNGFCTDARFHLIFCCTSPGEGENIPAAPAAAGQRAPAEAAAQKRKYRQLSVSMLLC